MYLLLGLDILYAYNALMLFFGLGHCLSIVFGEGPSAIQKPYLLRS